MCPALPLARQQQVFYCYRQKLGNNVLVQIGQERFPNTTLKVLPHGRWIRGIPLLRGAPEEN